MSLILKSILPLILAGYTFMTGLQAAQPPAPAEALAHQHLQNGDWSAARAAFAEAAETGSPTAMAYLGWMHEEGHGIEANDALAVIWYTRAVQAGAEHLALKLGWLHLGGSEAVRNRQLAEQWFEYAIARGEQDAQVALASLLIADAQGGQAPQRVHQAREWLLSAHQGGHPVAKFFLAKLYLEGIGAQPVDYAQAFYYARLGAEQGHAQMQGWLAMIYKDGLGRDADPVEAATWASLASIGGDKLGEQVYAALSGQLSEAQLAQARQRALDWAAQ